jgi:hypothetical protein
VVEPRLLDGVLSGLFSIPHTTTYPTFFRSHNIPFLIPCTISLLYCVFYFQSAGTSGDVFNPLSLYPSILVTLTSRVFYFQSAGTSGDVHYQIHRKSGDVRCLFCLFSVHRCTSLDMFRHGWVAWGG